MAKICVLQLNTLAMSDSRIDYYLKLAKERGAGLVLIGEYVLNSFFTEIIKMPKSMIKEQSEHKRASLLNLAKKYDLIIVAPIILLKGKDIYKVIAKFSPQSVKYEEQNIFIDYSHWNESKFFKNSKKDSLSVMSFTYDRFKFGVMFGYETHFDRLWQEMMSKKIDCVLVPTACTLNSKDRWNELLKMRAFTNNIYILRANRLGKAKFDEVNSEFYGNSMLISPHGEIMDSLDTNEGMLVCELDKKLLNEARSIWKFSQKSSYLQEFKG
ncbi:carbon-nitrogen hydrolase family protein [Campylobacter fetus]|uniref:carbon-nitrogen hydrolase family protein n=1 Tax=Campylobacter fetus TaxID=196 RepID=UPI000818BEE7|nr:carbon-nitrogen hydrolase family protein [Campylobacter fetus]AVK80904.1 carbon-nitrogen hydrolase family protein [Campylobacter fetus subsp. testudinum]MPB71939.1 carbon-nitrogen hydrolase family protein [Campylobacter fetus]MPB77308.1 carbon-nitrogen hydrolase family protein [Campylobacter fetus]OCR87876.1 carbon-nitrogen hydrolase [Campylobacter fetus subsp. testudinum]OCR88031.1 carbon-nitrogen hydrolase [Campylobacter fetus subsp. testudinum]